MTQTVVPLFWIVILALTFVAYYRKIQLLWLYDTEAAFTIEFVVAQIDRDDHDGIIGQNVAELLRRQADRAFEYKLVGWRRAKLASSSEILQFMRDGCDDPRIARGYDEAALANARRWFDERLREYQKIVFLRIHLP